VSVFSGCTQPGVEAGLLVECCRWDVHHRCRSCLSQLMSRSAHVCKVRSYIVFLGPMLLEQETYIQRNAPKCLEVVYIYGHAIHMKTIGDYAMRSAKRFERLLARIQPRNYHSANAGGEHLGAWLHNVAKCSVLRGTQPPCVSCLHRRHALWRQELSTLHQASLCSHKTLLLSRLDLCAGDLAHADSMSCWPTPTLTHTH
jgi:hypothetical protein